ncbi:hypothetical protein DPMN_112517 [Dreissena polymorpha]|uniref:Uncharacterized protein n=1 Tax=Dreissena polymorpha TaxID=45954 RepID=A0A9D4KGF8_DREPO|nr:hypothetical protein DPMN_112517 [Dreissena polymorpha]
MTLSLSSSSGGTSGARNPSEHGVSGTPMPSLWASGTSEARPPFDDTSESPIQPLWATGTSGVRPPSDNTSGTRPRANRVFLERPHQHYGQVEHPERGPHPTTLPGCPHNHFGLREPPERGLNPTTLPER